MKRNFRRGLAAVCALAMLAPSVAFPAETRVNAAYQLLGETTFDHKILPWMPVESSPAKQQFEITKDGELHIRILSAVGADREKWDLEIRHRNLSFQAGHTYELEVKVKAKREGMQLCSQISNITGSEYYCVLDETEFHNGPHSGNGPWGRAARLSTEWTTYKGTFTPTDDLEGVQWEFQYARGNMYEGNAVDGDELWFDSISLTDVTEGVLAPDGEPDYGYVNRKNSGLKNNYISVNQVGYLCDSRKVAVLGDDRFDMLDGIDGGEKIELKEAAEFELIDSTSGESVFKGKSTEPVKDEDSGDTVCKLDFSDFKTPGRYYLKSGDYISFEFNIGDDIYEEKGHDLVTNAMNYFYQNRSGIDIEEKYITSGDKTQLAHRGTHKSEKGRVQKVWKDRYISQDEAATQYKSSAIDSSGGWYEAGGENAKNVVSGAMAVWTLQNMYERAIAASPDVNMFRDGSDKVVVPETGNKVPDVLDETAYELDWMSKLKVAEDEPTWGENAAGLYYHKVNDHVPAGIAVKPWNYVYEDEVLSWEPVRIVSPPTFAATLGYAACAAQAARLWAPYDSEKADKYLASAIEAYEAYLKNYYEADPTAKIHPDYGYSVPAEELNEESLYAPMRGTETNNYGDYDVQDDAYLAACEIFISASKMRSDAAEKYLKELEKYDDAYNVGTRLRGGDNNFGGRNFLGKGSFTSFNWGNTAAAGTLSLALNKDLLKENRAKKVKSQILAAADEYIAEEEKQGYGIPYLADTVYENPYSIYSAEDPGYELFSNRCVLNNAVIMAYASDLSGDQKYKDGVTSAMDYLLGTNPLSFSYISGYGSYSMDAPYHRYWAESVDRSFPKVPDGVASSGPSGLMQDEYMKAMGFVAMKQGNIRQRCYADAPAWSVNSVSLETNASLAWVAAFLQNPETTVSSDPSPKPTEKVSPKPTASPKPTEKVSPKPTASPEPTEKVSPKPTASPEPTEKVSPKPTASPTEKASPLTPPTALPTSDPGVSETSDKYLDDPYIPGDVDCSGKVDLTDLTTLAISLVDNEPLFNMMEKNADVTGDGKVDLADLATLRQYLSKKITEFPAKQSK